MGYHENSSVDSMGLGDVVRDALSSVGISIEIVERWVGRPCGCEERKEKLNQLGWWARRVLSGKISQAKEFLEGIIKGHH